MYIVSLGINQIRGVHVQGIFANLCVLRQPAGVFAGLLGVCNLSTDTAGQAVPFPPGSVVSPRFVALEARSLS